jgi:hypothetical protein
LFVLSLRHRTYARSESKESWNHHQPAYFAYSTNCHKLFFLFEIERPLKCQSTNALEERRRHREPEESRHSGELVHLFLPAGWKLGFPAFSLTKATKLELTHNDRTNFFVDL